MFLIETNGIDNHGAKVQPISGIKFFCTHLMKMISVLFLVLVYTVVSCFNGTNNIMCSFLEDWPSQQT